MKRVTVPSCALVMGCLILLQGSVFAREQQDAPRKKAGFSIGYKQYYAWWMPVWEEFELSKVKTSALLFRGEIVFANPYIIKPGSNFLYNPVFSARFSEKWSLSGSFLYGHFTSRTTRMTSLIYQTISTTSVLQFSRSSAREIHKYDADLLLNFQVHDNIKLFIGPKYQGYDFTFIRKSNLYSLGNIPYNLKDDLRFHSFGAGIGASFTAHLGAGIFLIPAASFIYLSGRDYYRQPIDFFQRYFRMFYIDKGSPEVNMVGTNGTLDLAYPLQKIGLTLSAGFRCQYLYYINKIRGNYTRDFDLFFGPNLAVIFSF